MRHRLFNLRGWLLWVIGLAFAAATLAAAPATRHPVPSPAALQKATALVQELYQDEFARAQKDRRGDRGRLATTLLFEGKDTTDDLAGRYVLFREARDLASQAGDAATALQAIEALAQDFAVTPEDAFAMKVHALDTVSRVPATPDSFRAVVEAALVLLDEAVAADRYEAAAPLLTAAETAARKLKSVPLVLAIRRRGQTVRALQKDHARLKPYADKLRDHPNDPRANLELGTYQALIRGNWDRGLPLLARGSDATLQALARMELPPPREPSKQAALADRWAQAAATARDGVRLAMRLRAVYWYQQALPHLPAPEQAAAAQRLQALSDLLPPEYRAGDLAVELRRLDGHRGPVFAVAFSSDGRKALSGAADGSVRLWDTQTGKEVCRLDGHVGPVWTVAFAPGGRAVSGGFDHRLRLWDLASAREVRCFEGHTDYVRSVAVSADGGRLLSGGDDRTLRLWDAATGKEIRRFAGHDHYVFGVALSADGRRALSASLDHTVRPWDVDTGQELRRFMGHEDTVLSVGFCPDGRHALSGSTDRTLRLWDLQTGREVRVFRGHSGYVHRVVLSPDGRRALSASQDHTVRLWDVDRGTELQRLAGHTDMVWAVAFSGDGRLGLSAGHDGTVRLWGGARR